MAAIDTLFATDAVTAARLAPTDAQLAGTLGALAEASPVVVPVVATVYLVVRLLIPAILIAYTTRHASTKHRIALLRDYLQHTVGIRQKDNQ